MRLPRVPRLRALFTLPAVSPTARANGWVIGIFTVTFSVISWNTHAKPAGAYRGAVPMAIPDVAIQPTPAQNDQGSGQSSQPSNGPKIEGRLAMRLKHSLMLDARARLQTIPDYLANFSRQERVNGKLLPRESTELKVRHSPFSVYMKWQAGADVGREVLFVKGQHGDKLLVKKGGKVGEMLPTFKLEPTSDLAMKESRYPITTSGVLNLVEKIVTYCDRDLKLDEGVSCQLLADQKIDGRMCYTIRTDYGCAEVDPDYRCSVVFVDKETSLPLCVKNYGWSAACGASPAANDKLTDETLVEFYAFSGLRYQVRLSEKEFDQANREYHFKRD